MTTERNIVNKAGSISPDPKLIRDEVIFSLPGGIIASGSPIWSPRDPVVVTGMKAFLRTPGTTNTAVDVFLHVGGVIAGTPFLSAGLAANQNVGVATPCYQPVGTSDWITVGVLPGTGAADLTVFVLLGAD